MPIYTKKGDRGETGLFNGKRVAKTDAIIEAIGSVDELNAQIGVVKNPSRFLDKIQNDLFAIGSILAGAEMKIDLAKRVEEMEKEIDGMWGKMPPLKNFILPTGQVHVARAVCRRAERSVVFLATRTQNPASPAGRLEPILKYLNRLSDYLFCLARYENWKRGIKEVEWKATV